MIRTSFRWAALCLLALAPAVVVAQTCGGDSGIHYTPLMAAARANNVNELRRLLKKGANPNQTSREKAVWNFHEGPPCKISVLTIAVEAGGRRSNTHVDGVRVLLDAGAKMDSTSAYYGPDAWLAAARVGDLAALKLLWERGDQPLLRRSSSTVMPLVYQSMAVMAPDAGELSLLDYLVDNTLFTPLDAGRMEAMVAMPSARPLVLHLLERGVRPSPATVAEVATSADSGLLATMLRKGAPVNGFVNEDTGGEHTVLMRAVGSTSIPNPANVALLLDAGARVEAVDSNGMTALQYAVSAGSFCGAAGQPGCEMRLEIVKLLLARGASADRVTYAGVKSALEIARRLPEPNRAAFISLLDTTAASSR